jgi:DUF1680 family protein
VYAIETADLPGGVDLEDVRIVDGAAPRDEQRPDLPGRTTGLAIDGTAAGQQVEVQAIPYFAWANRGPGGMRVWIPRADS